MPILRGNGQFVGVAATIAPGATGGPLYLSSGSPSAPAYSFSGTTNTGMYSPAVGFLSFTGAGTEIRLLGSNLVRLASGLLFGWSSGVPTASATDLTMARLAAASLRLGSNPSATPLAQTFTIGEASRPGTDTDTGGASGTVRSGLGTGTGAASSLIFQTPTLVGAGTDVQTYATRLTVATAAITSTVDLLFSADNAKDIGAVGATRPRSIYAGTNIVAGNINSGLHLSPGGTNYDIFLSRTAASIMALTADAGTTGAALEMWEQTAPGAGAANSCRLYCADVAGKTTLFALFSSGAAIPIAAQV